MVVHNHNEVMIMDEESLSALVVFSVAFILLLALALMDIALMAFILGTY
jgi:hypothetical protein